MGDKNLSESSWKSFADRHGVKDTALMKALAELAKAEKAGTARWLPALQEVNAKIEVVRKANKSDKDILAQLKLMDVAVESERRTATKQAETEQAEQEADDASPAVLTTQLIPLLREVRKGGQFDALIAVSSKEAAVMLSRRSISASARKPLTAYLDAGSAPKFIRGLCIFEANAITFVLEGQAPGLAKKLTAALLKQTDKRGKVRVRNEKDEVEVDGEDEAESAADADVAAVPANVAAAASVAASAAEPANIAAAQTVDFKRRFAVLVPQIKTLKDGGWTGAAAATVALSEAATMVGKDAADALLRLGKLETTVAAATLPAPDTATAGAATRSATTANPDEIERKKTEAAAVEVKRQESAVVARKLAGALAELLKKEPPDVSKLKLVIEGEFNRAAELAQLTKAATEQGLPIAPSPAKVGFTVNADPDATQWTEPVCHAAFRKYGWFTFKALRKNQTEVELDGLTTQNKISDAVMWKLYQFRRHYVDKLIAGLHRTYPDAGLLFKSAGSEDIESDLDITVASPGSGVDVEAMQDFNNQVMADFGRPPGRVFDTNLYARDYRSIEDNLSAAGEAGTTADQHIAEPVGPVSAMAGIDQDVATLMKQRRFLDEASFTKMWKGLRDTMPEGVERQRIQQRFEEAEDVYLLTAKQKVDEIVATVRGKLKDLPAERRASFETKLAAFEALDQAAQVAKGGDAVIKALADAQRQLPEFLDFLEEAFPDEVMETTDAIYAETMTALRKDQAEVDKLEAHLLEAEGSAPCETLHKGVNHADWLAKAPTAVNALKARIKQAQFTNIVFANEAYVSQGALAHIVAGNQASTPQKKAAVLEKIQPAELLQSANEQMADFYKDMKHLEHGAKAAAPGQGQRRANGEAFVHASKYLSRMLDAAAMLQDKYKSNEAAMAVLTGKTYDLCARAKVVGPKELQAAVDLQLLRLRKSSTLASDAKAEVAVAEVQTLFQVADIAGLRDLITAFGVDFNERVRKLADFRAAQEVSRDTEREYFRPATR